MTTQPLDMDALRERLAKATGKQYWRSLDELADNEEFHQFIGREFPRQALAMDTGMDRRTFMKVMGASLALAGLTGCAYGIRQPQEKIVPYVRMPENIIPGKPLFYATTLGFGGYGFGALAETHEGRPTKLEGNPDHPASLGRSSLFLQAAVLEMYDPDRSQNVLQANAPSKWESFVTAFQSLLSSKQENGGQGFALLTETVTSPSLNAQIQQFLTSFPQARWYVHNADDTENVYRGAELAFGESVQTSYDLTKADVILSLDSDFLSEGPGAVRYSIDYATRRKGQDDMSGMNRMYAAEPTITVTGTGADHRLRIRYAQIETLTRAIAQAVGVADLGTVDGLSADEQKWATAVAEDLKAHSGASVVITGPQQPPIVHALVHAINQALNNVGQTVFYHDPVEVLPTADRGGSLSDLATAIGGGEVDLLVIIDANPVYTAPADLGFGEALKKVQTSVHLGTYADETGQAASWHINKAHDLESWADWRAYDGTVSLTQPMILPLYDGKTPLELLGVINGKSADVEGYDLLLEYWQSNGLSDETTFKKALLTGIIADSQQPTKSVNLTGGLPTALPSVVAEGIDILIRPDPTIGDGRWSNNGWLMELPNPFSKVTWDNPIFVSPITAQKLGLAVGDLVTIAANGQQTEGPIWIQPGQADDTATVYLGYGRTWGRVAEGAGFNAYVLRTTAAPFVATGTLTKTGKKFSLASTQTTQVMEGRDIVRTATLAEFTEKPNFLHIGEHGNITLYPSKNFEGLQWGMSIDLNTCLGCGICTVACQAENNIAVVGKDQVARGRVMHWLRMDRYYEGSLDDPTSYSMAVACLHCENAPCESVCPVNATTHSADGLNQMIYNRCVGTRYCSNNCPYKVRRFNFLQYGYLDEGDESYYVDPIPQLKLMRNPNVTVRGRGVMEKCTYCVQRIASARQEAERTKTELKDGDVVTACQQACPTGAIVFGNINDPQSKVSQLKAAKLSYSLLEELNTAPRTTYMARISNPNPALA